MADLKLPSADRRTAPYVTISVGVSNAVPSSMETYNGMIKAADDELYYAKNHGKNMVSFREMPPEKESEMCIRDSVHIVHHGKYLHVACIQ